MCSVLWLLFKIAVLRFKHLLFSQFAFCTSQPPTFFSLVVLLLFLAGDACCLTQKCLSAFLCWVFVSLENNFIAEVAFSFSFFFCVCVGHYYFFGVCACICVTFRKAAAGAACNCPSKPLHVSPSYSLFFVTPVTCLSRCDNRRFRCFHREGSFLLGLLLGIVINKAVGICLAEGSASWFTFGWMTDCFG